MTSRRRVTNKPLAELGPLKVVPFANPSGATVFRVTGTIFGKLVRYNYRTFDEAKLGMQETLQVLLGSSTLEELSPANLVRTWLSREQVSEAEEVFRRIRGSGFRLFEVVAAGCRTLEDVQALRANARNYLEKGLAELKFGADPVRKPHEQDAEFQARQKRAKRDQLLLQSAGTEVDLAVLHFVATSAKRNLVPATVDVAMYVLQDFVRTSGIKVLAELTHEKIFAFISRSGVKARTQKDQRGRLYGFCHHLTKAKLLLSNPVLQIDQIRPDKAPIVIASVGQVQRTLEVFSTWLPRGARFGRAAMLPRLLLYVFSPLRPDEIGRLASDWSDFNLQTSVVQVVRSKTGTENRTAHLNPHLVSVLSRLREMGCTPNFLRREVWEHWLKAGGIPGVRDVLRHSFASHSFAIDPDLNALAKNMNNSLDVLRRHYVKTSVLREEGLAYFALLEKIQSFLAQPEFRYVAREEQCKNGTGGAASGPPSRVPKACAKTRST